MASRSRESAIRPRAYRREWDARSEEPFHICRRRCPTATSARRYSKRAAMSEFPTSGNAFARTVLDRLLPLPESKWRQAADTSLEIIAPFLGDVVSIRKTLGCYRIHESNHGMLGDELDSRKLRVKIVIDLQREWALSEFASRSGFTIPRNWAAREPAHLKYRLASSACRPDPSPDHGRSAGCA